MCVRSFIPMYYGQPVFLLGGNMGRVTTGAELHRLTAGDAIRRATANLAYHEIILFHKYLTIEEVKALKKIIDKRLRGEV